MSSGMYKLSNGSKVNENEFAGKYELTEQDEHRDLPDNVQPDTLKEEDDDVQSPEKKHSQLEQLWDSLHEWADNTTLHGIRYVFDRNAHLVRRAIWFVIMAVLLSYLVWNGQSQVNRYLKYSTLTVQTFKVHEKLHFPSITICKSDFIRNNSITNETELQLFKYLLQTTPNKSILADYDDTFLKSMRISDLIVGHVINIDDFILDCTWGGLTINCSNYFESSLSESGLCFTVKKGKLETILTGEKHGLQIKLWYGQDTTVGADDDTYGIKVLVHGDTEEPIVEPSTLIGPGLVTNIPVKMQEYTYLPNPVAAFGTQYCKNTDDSSNEHYTLTNCYRQCRQDYFLKHCGCISYYDNQNDKQKECNAYEIIDCYQETFLSFMAHMENCHCAIPCHVTKYETKLSSSCLPKITYKAIEEKLQLNEDIEILKENIIVLKVFYESKEVAYTDQILDFTFEDIWASFGGYFGLFAGASVITFMEVLDVIALNVYQHIIRMRRVMRDS